jgi:hypothetical protein
VQGDYPIMGTVGTDTVPFAKNQLILWKPSGTSPERFTEILDSLTHGSPNMSYFYCQNCDSSLVRLESPDIASGLGASGQLASTGTGGSIGPSGDPEVYWSRNFNIKINDFVSKEIKVQQHSAKTNISYTGDPVVVAIFDTGIDPNEVAGYNAEYVSAGASCLRGANSEKGWNFPDNSSDINDNYMSPHGHGANVASIVMDKVAVLGKAPVQILPVKFISNGTPNLFDVLCGIAYAKNRGANIINASFGYYACLNTDPAHDGSLLFKSYLDEYTNQGANKIMVIAAAGNKDDFQQRHLCGNPTRSLDEINFYPASFAKDPSMPNIIAVTTVAKGSAGYSVSPNQNRSANVVDIGVIADDIEYDNVNGDKYLIRCPRMMNDYVEGSSYAAPVLTGLIASYFRMFLADGGSIDRNALLNFLKSQSAIMGPMNLAGEIRFGLMKH